MGKFVGGVILLVVLGSCFGGEDGSGGDGGSDSGYSNRYDGGWHNDSNGNPVPDDCSAWADSSDNPFEDGDPFAEELCNAW